MPRIDELGAAVSNPHEEAQREGTAVAAGGVVVGVDATAQAANITAKETAVEDARLSEMQKNAQVYGDDWKQQSSQLGESLTQSWGWDDREAEEQIKALCKGAIDEASTTTAAILDTLENATTTAQAQHADDAFKQVLAAVERFTEVIGSVNVDGQRDAAAVDAVREALERTQADLGRLRNDAGAGEEARVDRREALTALRDEAQRLGVEILTDADPEIRAYMDDAARREGVEPQDMQAITLGDTIVIREAEAENVRILREEMIHIEQQRGGLAIGAGQDPRTDMELDARRQMVDRAGEWGLTGAEVEQIKDEIRKIEERGKY